MNSPFQSYEAKAESIIEVNKYMVVATSGKKGKPWAAAVFYVYDYEGNFYFLSAVDSIHIKNATENPSVSLVIFDSNQPLGTSDSVQVEGKLSVAKKADIKKVITLYCKKLFPRSDISPFDRYNPEDYTGASEFQFFAVKVEKAYTSGPDRRVEVELRR
ncbi:MAG: pyridoxamine 5'-phosphate oxidase family protein [Candidatus Micrarchaeota archaeon]|nr:pyridoxamine 5'-phosphate oxidase family protein [Candidatus Micrarchaeota archaeon]